MINNVEQHNKIETNEDIIKRNNETNQNAEFVLRDWLGDTKQNYMELSLRPRYKYFPYISKKTNENNEERTDEKINLFTQYYIDNNKERGQEIINCLILNLHNKSVDKIYLLNEKIYSDDELGIKSDTWKDKLVQVNINKRLTYKDVFDYVDNEKINGYIVLHNSDIFFDSHINNLKKSNCHDEKKIYCQLRIEYEEKKHLKDCKLFGPRQDSQDSWMFHSNFNINKKHRDLFDLKLGIPGCDNNIAYLFTILGYMCYNEPLFIKTYHYHLIQKRNYDMNTTKANKPWVGIVPNINNVKIDNNHTFHLKEENDNLHNYVKNKLENKEIFILPRIAGIENNYAMIGALIQQSGQLNPNFAEFIKKTSGVMKNNAGIKFTNINDVVAYSKLYLDAFHKCDAYFDWEPWGDVVAAINESYNFVSVNFEKPRFWSFSLDIFHNIYNKPWTHALKGKRLLIISPFINSFKSQLSVMNKIYDGVILFPECSFVFLKPPQTQGTNPSKVFHEELDDFNKKIEEIKDDFDVALVSCGGYGNLVCEQIYSKGKSSIYIGGVLQMYFGIYGERWVRERPDVMKLFKNEYWKRPLEEEKPHGSQNVEGSAYW